MPGVSAAMVLPAFLGPMLLGRPPGLRPAPLPVRVRVEAPRLVAPNTAFTLVVAVEGAVDPRGPLWLAWEGVAGGTIDENRVGWPEVADGLRPPPRLAVRVTAGPEPGPVLLYGTLFYVQCSRGACLLHRGTVEVAVEVAGSPAAPIPR